MACGWLKCGRSDKPRADEPTPTPPSPIARPALRSSPPTRTVATVPAVIKSPIPIRPISVGGDRTSLEILELEESVSNLPTRMRVRRSPKLGHITEEGSSVGGDSPEHEVEGSKRKGNLGSFVPSRPISPIALTASRPGSPGPASSALPSTTNLPSFSRPNSPPLLTPSRPISVDNTSQRGSLKKNIDGRTFSASTSMDSFHTALETASIPEEEELKPPRSVV